MSFDLEKKLALDLYLNLSGTHGFKFELLFCSPIHFLKLVTSYKTSLTKRVKLY